MIRKIAGVAVATIVLSSVSGLTFAHGGGHSHSSSHSGDVTVHGYYRSNGTYVAGYHRSAPDGNPYNNWSFPGNINPYTGKVATGNPETYLIDHGYTAGGHSPYYPYSGHSTGSTDTSTITTANPLAVSRVAPSDDALKGFILLSHTSTTASEHDIAWKYEASYIEQKYNVPSSLLDDLSLSDLLDLTQRLFEAEMIVKLYQYPIDKMKNLDVSGLISLFEKLGSSQFVGHP